MGVCFGSYVDTGVTGPHTPQDVRVALLQIISEVNDESYDETYGVGLLGS
jgi:hypothetical protein